MEQAKLHTELNSLERKVQLLLNEHQLIKDELKQVKAENQDLKQALNQKEGLLKDFQNQDKISKIVGTIGKNEAETSEMREKIDEYIEEIDKCILHLTR